ncbi:transcriptional regulator protein [Rhizobium etli 8C-3]|uniref:Transcriptional regulator protein n=2 Tax=Rhizobium etli TaxID=29449 RepID=A0A1L5P330_RHIET|nr:transcriptional regulator protein [Rhizobium etli 8C-3]
MDMPRYKTVSDEQILDGLFGLILETGPDGLSFALAARACGLSPATMVQRFGNRLGLVEAVLLRAWDRLQAETEAADAEEALTPQGAINLLMRLMPPEDAERNAADGLLLLREDLRNPNLRARGARWGHTLACALGRRLSSDQHAAERLGWQMAALWQGAHTWWAFTRTDKPEQAIRRMLEEWLTSTHKA